LGIRRTILALLLFTAVAGCGTTYNYHGYLSARDAGGQDRVFLVYWELTERPLWFDTAEGDVRLLAEGRAGTALTYKETEDGIVLIRGPEMDGGEGGAIAVEGICGRILGPLEITDLGEGTLRLTVLCGPLIDDEGFGSTGTRTFVPAPRVEPYEFIIRRVEKESPEETPGFPVPDGTHVEQDGEQRQEQLRSAA
jgi:hypothetical protein